MTFELLSKIIKENNIPKDVRMMSDSGWECSETNMDGVFYNKNENVLVITQNGGASDHPWFHSKDYEILYGINKTCSNCRYLAESDCKNKNAIKQLGLDGSSGYVSNTDTSSCVFCEKVR